MNQCGHCRRAIEHEPALFARGRLWHMNHLFCDTCSCRIQEDEKFEEKEGLAICQHCYLENNAPKCSACHSGIEEAFVEAVGKTWHPSCFQCSVCLQPLEDEFVEDSRRLPMHLDCFWTKTFHEETVDAFSRV